MAESIVIRDTIAPDESEWFVVDFARLMNQRGLPGLSPLTITAIAATASLVSGSDGSPQARLLTGTYAGIVSPSAVASPLTQLPAQAVAQLIGGCVAGCVYQFKFVATMSNGASQAGILIVTCAADS